MNLKGACCLCLQPISAAICPVSGSADLCVRAKDDFERRELAIITVAVQYPHVVKHEYDDSPDDLESKKLGDVR